MLREAGLRPAPRRGARMESQAENCPPKRGNSRTNSRKIRSSDPRLICGKQTPRGVNTFVG